ncbi:folate/biopterin family MFS transporter [Floridanema evergladense]|uniref:Folate/biopterin family MFS transporter n=1 Tax=Floridaenema evergladense BLCC-F167 TaxID=3153639 RepID=A0ABV4WMN8_9CYAN
MVDSSSSLSKLKNSLTKRTLFGKELTPELIAILLVYVVQGVLGLARLAVSFFLKDELGLTPAQVSAFMGIAALPWMVKPLFGFISDGLPILGYRRRPYLILSGLLGSAAWISLATVVHSAWAATLAIALSSLSVAFSDVIVDSLVVERARGESISDAGSLQSLSWGASALGGLITAYLSGFLLQHFSTRTVFAVTATFPLIVSIAAWLIAESPMIEKPDFSTVWEQIKQLKKAVTQKAIWLPTAFLFIWQCTPTADAAFFFFTTNELGFQPEFLGRVRLVTSLASLLGIWLFQRFFKNVPFRNYFLCTSLLSAGLGMTALLLVTHTNRALGIDDHWFSLGDSLILTVMGQIAYMPVLVLAARLCPPGVEATLFALLMSVTNLAGFLSYQFGALLMHWLGITDHNFQSLWLLVIIANLSTLLPLLFVNWLPKGDPQAEISEQYIQPVPALESNSTASKHITPPFLPDLVSDFVPHSLLREAENSAE